MYLCKVATKVDAPSIEEQIDKDIANVTDGADFNTIAGRALLASPLVLGAYMHRNDGPVKGLLRGAGASAGGYAGYKGGKALAKQLENTAFMKSLTPEQQGLARLAAIAAGTGLGARLGWGGVGSLL